MTRGTAPGPSALVARLGGHPARELGIALDADWGAERWFVAACVLAERAPSDRGPTSARALEAQGMLLPRRITEAGAETLCAALAQAGHPRAEPLAHRIARACQRLGERHEGRFDVLAAGCDDLEALGGAIAALASGIGTGTVLRFLRPLRERWPAAGDVPLDPAAVHAAAHLGWATGHEDTPESLCTWLERDPDPPDPTDLEAALERLGQRACRRGDPARCPLAGDCPLR